MGDRMKHIQDALDHLKRLSIHVSRTSQWYETKPVGFTRQRAFLNGVARIRPSLSPTGLFKALKRVERAVGRTPTKRWGPRVMDLDILLYGNRKVRSSRLTIPHPRLHERGFVLIPLSELMSLRKLPGLKTHE